jgi:hypothetical protein
VNPIKFAGRLFFPALAGILLFTAVSAQENGASRVDELYLAKDNGSGQPGEAASTFRPTDSPIYCVVILTAAGPASVKMQFVAADVAGIKAGKAVVTASVALKAGEDRVFFTGKPNQMWAAGKYRAEITLDGKTAKSAEFVVLGSAKPAAAESFARPARKTLKPRKKN